MRRALVVLVLLVVAGCGDDDNSSQEARETNSSTSTSTSSSCDPRYKIPLENDPGDECREIYLKSLAAEEGVELTDDAVTQAKAFCREAVGTVISVAMVNATLAWEDGSRPSPADDIPSFFAMATGLYCPQLYDDLRSLDD